MTATTLEFTPDTCCKRQQIERMDHVTSAEGRVHRVCTRCWTHWYGQLGAVTKYSRKQWDAFLEECQQRDREESRRWREQKYCEDREPRYRSWDERAADEAGQPLQGPL
jgi:hypothetical protein